MRFFKYLYILLSFILITYVNLPDPQFPREIQNIKTLRSTEPGDSETPLRRAYYTDAGRNDSLDHYTKEFNKIFSIPTLTYRLNYPPEEAQTLIRDQTRSTFLEEIVHPMRESLYINGFEPKENKDAIVVNGENYRLKITVRYLPSNVLIRILLVIILVISIWYFLLHITRQSIFLSKP